MLPDPSNRYAVGDRATRPWGTWEVLAAGAGYIVKRIVVDPGHRLSLQYHRHRSEHWVVTQGVAEVEIDKVHHRLLPGEAICVPLGAVHRMKSVGAGPLLVIEVQMGSRLDEDDIIRLEDDYARE